MATLPSGSQRRGRKFIESAAVRPHYCCLGDCAVVDELFVWPKRLSGTHVDECQKSERKSSLKIRRADPNGRGLVTGERGRFDENLSVVDTRYLVLVRSPIAT